MEVVATESVCPDDLGDFVLEYADAMGRAVCVGPGGASRIAFELGRPVRAFPAYRGQRNYPGWYWSATMGRHVGFESWVERDHLVALDFDARVAAIASQPFWLHWRQAGKARRHAPDFFVRLADGSALVVDSRPFELIEGRDAEAFAATGAACAQIGWQYAVWGEVDEIISANYRWLAGFRHPRHYDAHVVERLLAVFARRTRLMGGAERVGDPIVVLPALFHLMWRRELVADLGLVLGEHSLVVAAAPVRERRDV